MTKKIILCAALIAAMHANTFAQFGGIKKAINKSGSDDKKTTETAPASETSKTEKKPSSTSTFTTLPEEGISSPQHTKYLDQVVWATKRIPKTGANESDFKTTFTQDDNIYGRFYLSKGLANYPLYQYKDETKVGTTAMPNKDLRGIARVTYVFYADGSNDIWYRYSAELEALKPATGTSQVLFKKDKADEAGPTPAALVTAINNLSIGSHKIKMEMWGGSYGSKGDIERTETPVVSSEFTLQITKKASYGKNFESVATGKKEPTLEPKMLQLANTEAPKDASWGCKKFTKIKIIDADWEYEKNQLTGAIIKRSINAALYGVLPDGTCSYTEVNYEQSSAGAGKYTEPKIIANSSPYKIDCN